MIGTALLVGLWMAASAFLLTHRLAFYDTEQECIEIMTHSAKIVNDTYEALRLVSNMLYESVVEFTADLPDDVILSLPSKLAWQLKVGGVVADFRLPDRSVDWKGFRFKLFDKWFVLYLNVDIDLSFTIPNSEYNYYYINGVYGQGVDFTPVKKLTESDVAKDWLLIGIVITVITALSKLGQHRIADSLASKTFNAATNILKTQKVDLITSKVSLNYDAILNNSSKLFAIASAIDSMISTNEDENILARLSEIRSLIGIKTQFF